MWSWIIGVVLVIIVMLIILKIRKNNEYDSNLFESAKRRVRNIGDCCKKIGKFFGGGS